jgi:hypothetical protein
MSEYLLVECKRGYLIRTPEYNGAIPELYSFSTLAEVQEYLPTLFPQPPISEDI